MVSTVSPRLAALSELPDADLLVTAPGRVNLIGEHVDYNQGVVMPVAINKRIWLAVKSIPEPLLKISARDLEESVEISLNDLDAKIDIHSNPLPLWSLYPAAIAWVLRAQAYPLKGIQAVIASDLPMCAGLSSSAAIECAFALAFQNLNSWSMERMQIAQLCQQAENHYIGVDCGLMDQFAVLHGVARFALYFDTLTLEWQPIPIPAEMMLVIANSGKKRELARSAYNQRQQECRQAVSELAKYDPNVRSLRDISLPEFNQYSSLIDPLLAKRARHVVEEIDRVQQAAVSLMKDDLVRLGELMRAGHHSLRDLYEVSCPELNFLVETAYTLAGCVGARLTGAGFGGCTVNLVHKSKTQAFCEQLEESYKKKFSIELKTYVCQADRGAYTEKNKKKID